MTETTDVGPSERGAERAGWRRFPHSSLRARILFWYVGLLALATVSSIVVTRQVLHVRTDERLDAELVQEAQELRQLAAGSDPATGRPFGTRIARIFEVYLERNVPSANEALLTFVGGKPFLRSRRVLPYRLDRDAELVSRWGSVTRPERGSVETPAGRVEYIAVPLEAGDRVHGVFVAAIFRDRELAESEGAILAAGAVGIVVLLIGSVLAWRLADKILGPVGAVTRTAHAISETDLGRRIPVQGSDEIAHLAATFNLMLERLELAFATQRRFVEDAGHELRTPITIVRGHLELLGDDPEERRETVALVLDELDRMQRMVDDLLLLARAERPDFLELEVVDVAALTDELLAKAAGIAPRDWQVQGRGRGMIVADRQRLTQAVVQLCANAARHTAEGDTVVLGSDVRGREARFWVRDSGPGIPESQAARIFERFARVDGQRDAGGAGLGLAIVKAIAEGHGGSVEVASRPGLGATFTLAIPVEGPEKDGRAA